MNFLSDEEEEDGIGGDDDQTRGEEEQEDEEGVGDVANSASVAIALEAGHEEQAEDGNTPGAQVVPFFEGLGFPVSAHDHLIEIECNAECPTEIGKEERMHRQPRNEAQASIRNERMFERQDEGQETDDDTYAQVHDQLDGVGTDFREQSEGDEGEKGTDDGQAKEHKYNPAQNITVDLFTRSTPRIGGGIRNIDYTPHSAIVGIGVVDVTEVEYATRGKFQGYGLRNSSSGKCASDQRRWKQYVFPLKDGNSEGGVGGLNAESTCGNIKVRNPFNHVVSLNAETDLYERYVCYWILKYANSIETNSGCGIKLSVVRSLFIIIPIYAKGASLHESDCTKQNGGN